MFDFDLEEELKPEMKHDDDFWNDFGKDEEYQFHIVPGYFIDWDPIIKPHPEFGPPKIEPMTLTKTYRIKPNSERLYKEVYERRD